MKAIAKKHSQNDIRGWAWSQLEEDLNQDINLRRFIEKKVMLPERGQQESKVIQEMLHQRKKQKQGSILAKKKQKKMPIFPQHPKVSYISPVTNKQEYDTTIEKSEVTHINKVKSKTITQQQFGPGMKKSESCDIKQGLRFKIQIINPNEEGEKKIKHRQHLMIFNENPSMAKEKEIALANGRSFDLAIQRNAQKIIKKQLLTKMELRMNHIGITSNKLCTLPSNDDDKTQTARANQTNLKVFEKEVRPTQIGSQNLKKRVFHKFQMSNQCEFTQKPSSYLKYLKRTEGNEAINLQFNDKLIFESNQEAHSLEMRRLPSLTMKLKSVKQFFRQKLT